MGTRYRYAICNETFKGWPWPRICEFCAELGYHGLEIAPFTFAASVEAISTDVRRQIRQAAQDAGIGIVGLHWLFAGTQGLHLTSPDPQVRRRTGAYLARLVECCAELGGAVLVLGSPQQRNRAPGVSLADAFAYAADAIAQALPALEATQTTLALEPLRPEETNFLCSADEAAALIERLAHPRVRLHLDVKAMSAESRPIPEIIAAHARHLAHFHANDPNKLGPGMGDVRFEPIIAALDAAGYQGYLSVEVFEEGPGPEAIARQSIAYLRRVCEGRS